MSFRLASVMLLAGVTACAAGPEPIRWGIDTCDQCRMTLVDRRFGAELLGRRPYKFDGVDELARFLAAHPQQGAMFVTDGKTGSLIPASQAVYLSASGIKSPMGGHVMSFASRADAERYALRQGLQNYRMLNFAEALDQTTGGAHADR